MSPMISKADDLGPALLFCPGDRPERFAKAAAAGDVAVLDLEDGVSAGAKDGARASVSGFLDRAGGAGVAVRINHPTTERGRADADAVIASGGRILIMPKTESGAEVRAIAALRPKIDDLRLFVTIETATGLLALPEILEAPGVAAVSWGPYDLAADIGARAVRDGAGRLLSLYLHARARILLCAAAARIAAFDTVTTELGDPGVLARDAAEAAILGFAGKFAIHPTQVDVIRRSFCPSEDEIQRSRRLVAATPGFGAFIFEGEMIDEPMLRRARRTLALADRLSATAR
jgi:citrate lyase subunit beta/citryl-CoA lyase